MTPEERSALRALVTKWHDAPRRLNCACERCQILDAVPALLDALDRAERERDSHLSQLRTVNPLLDEARAEVERLTPECSCIPYEAGGDGPMEDCPRHGRPYSWWVGRADEARARLDAVRALHRLSPHDHEVCNYDGAKWPCHTIRALDGK